MDDYSRRSSGERTERDTAGRSSGEDYGYSSRSAGQAPRWENAPAGDEYQDDYRTRSAGQAYDRYGAERAGEARYSDSRAADYHAEYQPRRSRYSRVEDVRAADSSSRAYDERHEYTVRTRPAAPVQPARRTVGEPAPQQPRRPAAPVRAPRAPEPEQNDFDDEDDSPIYGGRAHDNIHAADARPQISRAPIIAMSAVLLALIVVVPMLFSNRQTSLDRGIQTAATATPEITAEPTEAATPAPTAEPTPTPLPDNLMVSQYTGRVLDRNKPAVALTYDDGPSKNVTPRILDALEQNGGLATFFLVGDRVENYDYIVQREHEMGCLVGTHLYSHTKLTTLSESELQSEIDKCNDAHLAVIGEKPRVARPPYGSANTTVKEVIYIPMFNWSLNSNDWETRNADTIYNDVMNNIQDGDIVLFHDLKAFSAEASERIIPDLVKQGYQLVTIEELYELKGREIEPKSLYSKRVTVPDEAQT